MNHLKWNHQLKVKILHVLRREDDGASAAQSPELKADCQELVQRLGMSMEMILM